jgi:hypothetical protein
MCVEGLMMSEPVAPQTREKIKIVKQNGTKPVRMGLLENFRAEPLSVKLGGIM